MKLIHLDAILAEIESRIKSMEECFNGKFPMSQSVKETEQDKGKLVAYKSILSFIDTLEVKEVYVSNPQFPHLKDIIDKVFGAGNLEFWEYDDAEQLVLLAKDEVISHVCEAAGMKKPYKDGNQWCILKGENIQEGICGFGDNIEDALVDFLRNIPKISLEVKEVGYVPMDNDFERDAVNFCFDNGLNTTPRIAKTIAKHFFELGLKAQKGE